MYYDREKFVNVLDLNEHYFRFGQAKKLVHTYKIEVYKNVNKDSYISIVTNSFINKVETILYGSSEEEVLNSAHNMCEELWTIALDNYNKNKERIKKANDTENNFGEINLPVNVNTVSKGQQFVGKKWMGNKETKERLRVDQSEVQKYLDNGWIFVGPRTKL